MTKDKVGVAAFYCKHCDEAGADFTGNKHGCPYCHRRDLDPLVTTKSVAGRLRKLKFHHVECLNCPYHDYWIPKNGCCKNPALYYFIDRRNIERLAKLYEDAK